MPLKIKQKLSLQYLNVSGEKKIYTFTKDGQRKKFMYKKTQKLIKIFLFKILFAVYLSYILM